MSKTQIKTTSSQKIKSDRGQSSRQRKTKNTRNNDFVYDVPASGMNDFMIIANNVNLNLLIILKEHVKT